jgi:hypothetical protein
MHGKLRVLLAKHKLALCSLICGVQYANRRLQTYESRFKLHTKNLRHVKNENTADPRRIGRKSDKRHTTLAIFLLNL